MCSRDLFDVAAVPHGKCCVERGPKSTLPRGVLLAVLADYLLCSFALLDVDTFIPEVMLSTFKCHFLMGKKFSDDFLLDSNIIVDLYQSRYTSEHSGSQPVNYMSLD